MDVGVVTPKKDGMNLVAKEMLLCNPKAGLMLSSGAGTELQLAAAGFYSDQSGGLRAYSRVQDVTDLAQYADTFHHAATTPAEVRASHGQRLQAFIIEHDIEKWSATFLDPSWSHDVIRVSPITTINDFYSLMFQTRNVRRQIVERILKGIPIRNHFPLSLEKAKESLLTSAASGTILRLSSDSAVAAAVSMDVSDELQVQERTN